MHSLFPNSSPATEIDMPTVDQYTQFYLLLDFEKSVARITEMTGMISDNYARVLKQITKSARKSFVDEHGLEVFVSCTQLSNSGFDVSVVLKSLSGKRKFASYADWVAAKK